ncbi:MAG: AI-2E family transporter [Acidimicrobiales bacterium]
MERAEASQREAPAVVRAVPWRTIWATIASVVAAYVAYQLFLSVTRIVTWLVVAGFFTIVLTPPVDFLQRKSGMRRGLATFLVFIVGLGLLAAMLYAFIRPVVEQASTFSRDLPHYVQDAREGKGWIGDIVRRYDLEQKVTENQDKIQATLTDLGAPALAVARTVFNTLLALLTIIVLTFLMLMEGPHLSETALNLLPDDNRERFRVVAVDAARAVSGYVFGNLLISVIAGLAAWIVLTLAGVPHAGVLGLFVAFADLIPLVGATLGAVPTIGFAFLHGIPAGIAALVFFIIYQQFENHVLQVGIMSRTVKVNPLTVLISVLIGVELFGFLGALLAIPVAGILQVVIRDIYDEHHGRLKPEPTVGASQTVAASATTE